MPRSFRTERGIIPYILAQIKQVRSLLTFVQRINVDGVVVYFNQGPNNDVKQD